MTATAPTDADETIFQQKLQAYKQLIDDDIRDYSEQARKSSGQHYGPYSQVATDAFLGILSRGGKRIRGVLTMIGYGMLGGTDTKMILEAARAVEMLHAYILIIDDIQDRSLTRRGGPTAQILLKEYHEVNKLADDPAHFGIAIALNAALFGSHAAQIVLANLTAKDEDVIKAVSIMNRTMMVIIHGQTNDIFNEVLPEVDEAQVDRVLEWKTANYTFLNPIHMGMVLAGADCAHTDAITAYAMHAGRAFQITDDIIGTFGDVQDTGKDNMDDIREGKRTMLTVKALELAGTEDKSFLLGMLGNQRLTLAEFERCKAIITACGALDYAREKAAFHVRASLEALEAEQGRWNAEDVAFLRSMVSFLLVRAG